GDLHLGNIVLWGGAPLLFDALEFDDRLASVDTLYDVAFLLMDLDAGGHRVAANLILNRIVSGPRGATEIDGFAALPLMLALRAAIRAMVGAERADQEYGDARTTAVARARGYLGQAISYLAPAAPMLVAVGGFSGTGKSTLAAALAPGIGGAPGALHIRADVERKAMFGVDEGARLQPAAYAAEVSPRVYAAMMDKARRALAAGHSVVIDAVFSRPGERVAAEAAAASVGTPFKGLWLEARRDVLVARVERRSGDASDATPDVVAGQLARGAGDVFWTTVEAGGTAESTLTAARRVLGLK
ncbi:MAG: AAA family ATPase, partial [Hyphomicrobium sp.]